jgi:tRNA C32,U32 (ribose-2'-O)-methylase TrmJ
VLVSPKMPVSVGTVARACSCFECEDVRIVSPRCDHLQR